METLKHRAKTFLASLKPGKAVATVPETGTAVSAEMGISECPNCHAPLDGSFCHGCGQKNVSMLRPIWYLIADLTEDIISRDSKLWRTLGQIIFLPGTMTRDFMDGRRARFVPPIRLYLLSTLLFFVSLFVADIAILRLEVHDRGPIKSPEQEAQAFQDMMQGLSQAGLVFEEAPELEQGEGAVDTQGLSPEDAETLRDMENFDPFADVDPEDMPPGIPEDVREELRDVREFARSMRDMRRDIAQAVSESGGERTPELMEALGKLDRIAREQGTQIRLSDEATPDQLKAMEAMLDQQMENFAAATGTDDEAAITVEGRRYGMEAKMFETAEPSADAVALPDSALEDELASLDRKLQETDPETFEYYIIERAQQAMRGAIAASDDPRRLNNALNDWLSRAMIVLLPIFAFLLRLFYWGKENNLMKQFVFSLHFHTYIFLVMTFLVVSQSLWGGAVSMSLFFIVVPLYLLAGMKVASKQGWFRTIFKFIAVSFFYLFILSITVVSTLLMSFADV